MNQDNEKLMDEYDRLASDVSITPEINLFVYLCISNGSFRLQCVEKQACKGAFGMFGSQPHQPIKTREHSHRFDCLIVPEGGKQDGLENPHCTAENKRTTQLNMALAGYQTRVTLVRGERFTHKPTMPALKPLSLPDPHSPGQC